MKGWLMWKLRMIHSSWDNTYMGTCMFQEIILFGKKNVEIISTLNCSFLYTNLKLSPSMNSSHHPRSQFVLSPFLSYFLKFSLMSQQVFFLVLIFEKFCDIFNIFNTYFVIMHLVFLKFFFLFMSVSYIPQQTISTLRTWTMSNSSLSPWELVTL